MKTTSHHPHDEDPPRDPGPHGGGDVGRGTRRSTLVLVAAIAVVVLVVVALGWLFLAGPLSSSAKDEHQVEQTLKDMSSAGTFSEFNSYLCAENRVPQDLVDTIMGSGQQTGTDVDTMLRESIAGSFPDDMKVTGVELGGDGTEATATVESGAGDEEASEEVQMRQEDGSWKVCEPGVGMGSVPQEGQPS